MIVKVCGITTKEAAHEVAISGADMIGFVFAPSRRRITPQTAKEISQTLSPKLKKVGVFVNESVHTIIEIAKFVQLDFIQLHGDETKEEARLIPYPVIRAFSINNVNVEAMKQYPCEYLLVDSPAQKYRGGSGEVFDWDQLKDVGLDRRKLMLAGGLTPENIHDAIKAVHPAGVDVSSGVETDGEKDPKKIIQFVANVRKSSLFKSRSTDGF